MSLRLGVLGMSEGNGHPYSWSAICNGYDVQSMSDCPFPVIPQYLAKQKFPQDQIAGVRVTHIWTQSPDVSHHVARASRIPTVCESLSQMIGEVDAVLLARDDAETHEELSTPFLEAGLPVYIDKPLAYDTETARRIFDREKYRGQVFSCSSLRFGKEFSPHLLKFKSVDRVEATVPKNWGRYAIHVLEPIFAMLNVTEPPQKIIKTEIAEGIDQYQIWFSTGPEIQLRVSCKQPTPLGFEVFSGPSSQKFIFTDTYFAFKSSIEAFLEHSCRRKSRLIPKDFTINLVETLQMGMYA